MLNVSFVLHLQQRCKRTSRSKMDWLSVLSWSFSILIPLSWAALKTALFGIAFGYFLKLCRIGLWVARKAKGLECFIITKSEWVNAPVSLGTLITPATEFGSLRYICWPLVQLRFHEFIDLRVYIRSVQLNSNFTQEKIQTHLLCRRD